MNPASDTPAPDHEVPYLALGYWALVGQFVLLGFWVLAMASSWASGTITALGVAWAVALVIGLALLYRQALVNRRGGYQGDGPVRHLMMTEESLDRVADYEVRYRGRTYDDSVAWLQSAEHHDRLAA